MKEVRLFFVLFVLMWVTSNAQVYKESWAFGFGLTVPRFFGTDVNGSEFNGGIHSTIQANLSEHSNFRMNLKALMVRSFSAPVENNHVSLGFDYLYHFSPCENVNPYLGLGVSGIFYQLKNTSAGIKEGTNLDYHVNMLFGVQWGILDEYLGSDWKIKTELGYHTVPSDKFDGTFGPAGGVFGGGNDAFFSFDIGALYYFDLGTKAKYCDLYEGVLNVKVTEDSKVNIDYDKIESIVQKYSSEGGSDIDYNRIEDIVKRNAASSTTNIYQTPASGDKNTSTSTVINQGNWVLVGVNFNQNQVSFTPESYPVLINAAQILLANPDMRVEIQGHTDNTGNPETNKRISLARAEFVKKFLISKGVSASRLTTVGFGDTKPISDNSTAEGRAFNRRIEFRVIK